MHVDASTHPTVGNFPDGTILTSLPDGTAADRTAAATRRIMSALLHAGPGAAGLDKIADRLDEIADHLEGEAGDVAERLTDMWESDRGARHDPVCGPDNPIAPPLVLSGRDDGSVEGTVTLGLPYQGPPGHLHGGVAALLLDHTLGVANAWSGSSTATAQFNVRYHRPTPLFEPLTLIGRLVARDGRKIDSVGEIRTADGEVCVSVEALFIDRAIPRPH